MFTTLFTILIWHFQPNKLSAMIDIYKHAQNVFGNISVSFLAHSQQPWHTAMASGEEGDSVTKFVCPVHDLPIDVQAEVDELAARLGADDLEPLQKLAVQQFETYLTGVDHIIKDVITNEQLRTAWDQKKNVLLMMNYVKNKADSECAWHLRILE